MTDMKPYKLRIEKEFDSEKERDDYEEYIRQYSKKWEMVKK